MTFITLGFSSILVLLLLGGRYFQGVSTFGYQNLFVHVKK